MWKELLIATTGVLMACLLIALLPSLLEVGIGLLILSGLACLVTAICGYRHPRQNEA